MRKLIFGLVFLLSVGLQAIAQKQVTGTVTSADDGTSLPGVSVAVKGTTTGTVTDIDGKYSLKVPDGANTLVFSFMGMKTEEVEITGNVVDVVMKSDETVLTEVVVTALGIKRQPRELGYSVSKLDDTQIIKARTVNVSNALSGKTAGLQVNTVNNGVNASTRIVIRGNRSLTGNNQALMVLDGVPTDISVINALNPNDIENVSILKGANAAALYGADAANGVIMVTTKKGAKGKSKLDYNYTMTFDNIAMMPKFQNRFGSGSGSDANGMGTYASFENQSYGPEYDGSTAILGRPVLVNGEWKVITTKYSALPDEKMAFFNTGVTSQHNMSYSTGDDKNLMYISFQDAKVTGVVPKDEQKRNTLRFNASRTVNKLRLSTNMSYSLINTDVVSNTNYYLPSSKTYETNAPYWMVINTPMHIPLTAFDDWRNDPFASPDGYFNDYYPSPYMCIDVARDKSKRHYVLGNFEAEYSILPNLTALLRGAFNLQTSGYKNTTETVRFAPWNEKSYAGNGDKIGNVFDGSWTNQVMNGDFILSYDKEFGPVSLKALAGMTVRESSYKEVTHGTDFIEIDGFYNIKNRIGDPSLGEYTTKQRDAGAFADLTLGYSKFLFVHVTGRNDWTSRLTKENNSYFYPGVDVSFVLSEAVPAMQEFVNFAKIRAAYTKVGTLNLAPYATQNTFALANNFPYGSLTSYTISNQLNSPDIKPEMTVAKEVGLELSFLEDKINIVTALYSQSITNQTISVGVSRTTGFTGRRMNTGEMKNNGFELEINLTPVKLENGFTWRIGGNYTRIQNEVVSVSSDLTELALATYTGPAFGIYAIQGKPFPYLKVTDFKRDPNGRVIVDNQGYPVIDNTKLREAGQTNPTDLLGLNTSFDFKGLSLTAQFEYRHGAVVYHDIGDNLTFTGVGWLSASAGRQKFVYPNSVIQQADGKFVENTNLSMPTGDVNFWTNIFTNQNYAFVTSADFWRLRELSLTYTLPKTILDKTKIFQSMSVGLIGRNLKLWLPKSNYYTDPEFSNTTGNATGMNTISQTPPTRTLGFNISATF